MKMDLAILAVIAFFALWGAISGAAKQIANLVAIAAAYTAARYGGPILSPYATSLMNVSSTVGAVVAYIGCFLATLLLVRWSLTFVLRRILAGGRPDERGLDRGLGFVLGGARAFLVIYVLLSALAFIEDNVEVAGKRLGAGPKDSMFLSFARRNNVFASARAEPVKDYASLLAALKDPKGRQALEKTPEYQSLARDSRFQLAIQNKELQAAAQRGDIAAVLANPQFARLLSDPKLMNQLRELGNAAQKSAPK